MRQLEGEIKKRWFSEGKVEITLKGLKTF